MNIKPTFDKVVYALDEPKYHLFRLHQINRFTGWVFYFGKKKIIHINVYGDNQFIGQFPVNGLREDIKVVAPSIPAAEFSGFDFEINCNQLNTSLRFELKFSDGSQESWFKYDIEQIIARQDDLARLKNQIAAIAQPEGDIVFLTQGHHHTDQYQNSIIPGILSMQQYLSVAGVNLNKIHTLLDFGCGSGRFLVGWHLSQPQIKLHGSDINEQLIAWTKNNLPADIQCEQSHLMPPLDYQDNQFDLIYLISVFTHLSLEAQTEWVKELSRVMKIGGHILLSLHGELYVRNNFDQDNNKISRFLDDGFLQNGHTSIEGANHYSAFHLPKFVETLFAQFSIVGYFPNGQIDGKRTLSPIAHFQDVYVLEYQG